MGTVVRTGSGTTVRFYTPVTPCCPPPSTAQATVGIIAVEAGPLSNVKALTITAIDGDMARVADVLNNASTTGGTTKREAVVAAQDFDALQASVEGQLQQEAYQQLVAQLSADEFIPANSLDVQIMSYNFDQVQGERSDIVSMDMKIVAGGFAISNTDLAALATHVLESQAQATARRSRSSRIAWTCSAPPRCRSRIANSSSPWTPAAVWQGHRRRRGSRGIRGKTLDAAAAWLTEQYALRSAPR
jgi:hypothetical protein